MCTSFLNEWRHFVYIAPISRIGKDEEYLYDIHNAQFVPEILFDDFVSSLFECNGKILLK